MRLQTESSPGAKGPYTPMLATNGQIPRDPAGWAFEFKWDGVRAIVSIGPGRFEIRSRNGLDVTAAFPELSPLQDAVNGRNLVLDGEIVALDDAGRPSFERLQKRLHVTDVREARRLATRIPVLLFAFDLLALDGKDLTRAPFRERRTALESLKLDADHWQTPPVTYGDARSVFEASRSLGLEGLMAKKADSVYVPGARSPDWIKIKHRPGQEFVVGGWTKGEGSRGGSLGALLVGYFAGPKRNEFRYAGRVGTGFTDAEAGLLMVELVARLRPTSPFKSLPKADADAHWVEPSLVVQVQFAGFTQGGVLRQASFKGIRNDKDPEDVVLESKLPTKKR